MLGASSPPLASDDNQKRVGFFTPITTFIPPEWDSRLTPSYLRDSWQTYKLTKSFDIVNNVEKMNS